MDEIGGGDVSPEVPATLLIDVTQMLAAPVIDRAIRVERHAILARWAGEVISGHRRRTGCGLGQDATAPHDQTGRDKDDRPA